MCFHEEHTQERKYIWCLPRTDPASTNRYAPWQLISTGLIATPRTDRSIDRAEEQINPASKHQNQHQNKKKSKERNRSSIPNERRKNKLIKNSERERGYTNRSSQLAKVLIKLVVVQSWGGRKKKEMQSSDDEEEERVCINSGMDGSDRSGSYLLREQTIGRTAPIERWHRHVAARGGDVYDLHTGPGTHFFFFLQKFWRPNTEANAILQLQVQTVLQRGPWWITKLTIVSWNMQRRIWKRNRKGIRVFWCFCTRTKTSMVTVTVIQTPQEVVEGRNEANPNGGIRIRYSYTCICKLITAHNSSHPYFWSTVQIQSYSTNWWSIFLINGSDSKL